MFEFLTVSVDAYEQYNSSADVFAIPAGFDKNTCNIKASKVRHGQSIKQSTVRHKSVNRSINQPIDQSVNQSAESNMIIQ